ncbi:unnamed protein product [Rotaria sp. Silwood2]|nr:unnamed protein product [Rotaria sp. Silwood2]CAF2470215.1 unnamed protein product [Rotaria sp. Silwood2]CAF2706076.1 unnamed protein product [Rotaria sp. Silwood2]CAF2857949.1 unnamed protein product [Rotaria sp. Silwood2]CAF3988311.1 unnamed protein product [Rotaria sp. Silwood2]
METSRHSRAFLAYNNHNFKNNPSITIPTTPTTGESLVLDHISYSSIKTTIEKVPSHPPSPNPNNIVKAIPMPAKRPSSITSLVHLLPRRKSLQTTALASQRQSLWMSIAKNAQTNNTNLPQFPLRQQQSNLIRRKLLRLLLVFSYLLSISLFAIALATFYGFFWSGYSTTQTTIAHVSTVSSIVSLKSNSTIIDIGLSLKDVSSNK